MPNVSINVPNYNYARFLGQRLGSIEKVFPRSEIVHIPNGTRMPDVPNAAMDRAEAKG